jgi:quercetin dioxygenase-like cupin family protein
MDHTVLHDVEAELEIPEDGVLSRVLYRDDRIRVVGFAFDVDQELTEHTAAVPAILQVVSGSFRVSLGDTVEDLAPGSWVHMAANLPHSVLALERGTLLLTLMRDQSE